MPQEMPKYAAGSREDNIRTGREVHFGNSNKKDPWNIFPFIVLAVIALYFFRPSSGTIEAGIGGNPTVGETAVTATVSVTNDTNKTIYDVEAVCYIQGESGAVVGRNSVYITNHLKPGERASAPITITMTNPEPNMEIHASPKFEKLPFIGVIKDKP